MNLSTEEPSLSPDAKADRIVVEKEKHIMTLMKGQVPLKVYKVSLGRGGMEPKRKEGDNKVPEGIYRIVGRKSDSQFHLSLKTSYPELRDIEAARKEQNKAGSNIMIHGLRNGLGWIGVLHRNLDWTAGCIAVTNREIEEIWNAVPDKTILEIKP